MTARNVLVVDDEIGIRELLSEILQDEGYHVRLAENAAQARDWRLKERLDLVLLDIWMPDCDGITLLKEWGNAGLLTMPVVMMSGHGTIDTAIEATRIGAFDFLEKPIALHKLLKTVDAALKRTAQSPRTISHPLALAKSVVIGNLRPRLDQLKTVPVLLLVGAKGAIPELYARYLQQPEDMPWLELTSADSLASAPLELLAQVRDGLLYLPEVADLGKTEQKGLHLLIAQAHRFKTRVVCATTHNLPRLVQAGHFDAGLLQVLTAASLRIPSLAERRDDMPELARSIATLLAEAGEVQYREFDIAALNALRNASWPGELAQLRAVVKNLMLTSLGEHIMQEDVARVLGLFTDPAPASLATPMLPLNLDLPLRKARDAFERIYFEHHVAKAGGNMSLVAEAAGLERTHLYRKLKQLNVRSK